jgi:translation initiation factor IF-2
LSTVRIYKVAELLNTTSQEVLALLKRDHGIEVKSASGTIEEVVARQFVERVARQRGIQVPSGAIFADTPAGKAKRGAAKAAEPPKAATPALPPPRLVKTVKTPPPPAVAEPAPEVERLGPAETVAADEPIAASGAAEPELAARAPDMTEGAPATLPGQVGRAPESGDGVEAAEAGRDPSLSPAAAAGRHIPPTIRLRVEETDSAAGQPPKVSTPRPAPPRPVTAPGRSAPPAGGRLSPAVVRPPATKPTGPPAGAPRVAMPPPRPVVGGPRPLPTPPLRSPQTARPASPGGMPMPSRPGQPPFYRPSAPPRPGQPLARPGAPPRRPEPRRDTRGPMAPTAPAAPPPITRTITLAEGMTVKDLADKLDVRAKDVLKKLIERRMVVTINTTLDTEIATTIARDFGAEVQLRTFEEEMIQAESEEVREEDVVTRAPVVTVMGHVDHGKTTLLDAIRETRVAEREAGGITQHIGAYAVQVNQRKVVFLDTPGHEAFTLMRARGARVTDVVILVVAADDGVMPQTREAVDHARAAGVPILVAVNKIDKPDANPERVKRELADLGLVPEQWGGQTVVVDVSAKKKQNLDLLLEMVLLVTELSELKANPKRNASGTVLEAKLDKGRGPVATVLVQDGTLHIGDTVIAGTVVGKVRALIDDRGRQAKQAPPSTPVEVLGLGGLPQPGDTFQALTDAAKARQIAVFRQTQAKEKALGGKGGRLTLESLQQQIAEGGMKELPIIIKADVQGSAEVLAETLTKLTDEKVKIRIIHSGVGAINESDVLLASASNAIIIGFNVRPDRNALDVAERERVDIRQHSVIYNVTDEMKKAMKGLLEPTFREVRIGSAEVRQTFKVPKYGTIAGCMVTEGRITRTADSQARLLRDNVVVHEGRIGSLRRFKDDVSEVKAGAECGIAFERFGDIKLGDVIEVFTTERIAESA